MKNPLVRLNLIILFLLIANTAFNQYKVLNNYNPVWLSQSLNAGESMPVGGGDIGCNVWVEHNDLLMYFSQSGAFDENNTFLKSGRLRLRLTPNPFANSNFRQELMLKDGFIKIQTGDSRLKTTIRIWVDVFHPVIHLDIQCNRPISAEAIYENWRYADRELKGKENNGNSWKWTKGVRVVTKKDSIYFNKGSIEFFHRNSDSTIFDAAVQQQGLNSVKEQLFNPLKNLTSGGMITGNNFLQKSTGKGKYAETDFESWSIESKRPSKEHSLKIFLHHNQTKTQKIWEKELQDLVANYKSNVAATIKWWNDFWQRSYIYIHSNHQEENNAPWQMGRNYQLFRYMLGCNAFGNYPTKFNGGLFTVDPVFTDSTNKSTPDFRNWGGGTFTAQNQRLVYWPMLKSGDADMMKSSFDFYNRILPTAILRTKVYWGHNGANFNEQIENFGLPNPPEYGWNRPPYFDPGIAYNAWLEYEWDTVLEFCEMIMQAHSYAGADIHQYLPFIKNALIFFDEHYQYLAKRRGNKVLDENGHLILYPGSGTETFKMAYNANSTIAALKTVTTSLLHLPYGYLSEDETEYFNGFLKRIPPISFMHYNGKPTIAPAIVWSRVNNTESAMLYPVFPWGIYGVGQAGLDTARNTYLLDTFALKFRGYIGWKQDNIFAARLGLTSEAKRLTLLKLANSGRRFPVFWGPGFDWVPDHNWGGSGMIGLQEMLLQTVGSKVYLFPAWPKEWNVHFKLHAPGQTTVEAELKDGKLVMLNVWPERRRKDVELME